MKYRLVAAFMALILIGGCGYSFQGATPHPAAVRRIYIPRVQNPTIYTDLTFKLTNELVRKFSLAPNLRVANADEAEAVLKVTIDNVQTQGSAQTKGARASASRLVVVTAKAVIETTGKNPKTLWTAGRVEGRRVYPVSDQPAEVEARLAASLDEIALEIADKIYSGAIEDF